MLLAIGIALLVYGYISYKRPMKERQGQSTNSNWLPILHKTGGILFMIIGGLLIVGSFML